MRLVVCSVGDACRGDAVCSVDVECSVLTGDMDPTADLCLAEPVACLYGDTSDCGL